MLNPNRTLAVSAEPRGEITVIHLSGMLLGGSEGQVFRDAIYQAIQEERNRVVVDLSQIRWMNSSGLGMLVAGLSTLRASGGEMVLARVPDTVLRSLRLTRLESVFAIYDSVEEAVSQLTSEAP